MNMSPTRNTPAFAARFSRESIGRLALFTAVLMLGLVAYGAWVRTSGSGLGCPHWPNCDGASVPADPAAWIETGHRLYAGVLMLMVGFLAVLGFLRREEMAGPGRLLMASAVFILGQAVLGAVVVFTELHGFIRLLHLVLAMSLISMLTLAGIGLLPRIITQMRRRRLWHLVLAAAGLIMVGGSIVATGTGFDCLDLPLCSGRSAMPTWLHGIHRTLGVLVLLATALTAIRLARAGDRGTGFRVTAGLAALLLVQVGVGTTAVWLDLPLELRVLHVGIAATIWMGFSALWALSDESREPGPSATTG